MNKFVSLKVLIKVMQVLVYKLYIFRLMSIDRKVYIQIVLLLGIFPYFARRDSERVYFNVFFNQAGLIKLEIVSFLNNVQHERDIVYRIYCRIVKLCYKYIKLCI